MQGEAPRIRRLVSRDDDIVHARSNGGLTCKELVPGSSPGAGAWLATNRLRAICVLQASIATTTFTLTANSGNTASAALAIEVGAGDTPITFDQAVKLTFAGQAGKLIGWSQAGTFHQITAICTDNTQTTNNTLADGADCKIDVSGDLVVWTKHFSTFIAYTETAIPTPASSGSSRSRGGSSYIVPQIAIPVVAPVQGQVLGASTYNFTVDLQVGSAGPDVTALQTALMEGGYLTIPATTGTFGPLTLAAVKNYQAAKGITPQSGYVGPLTRAELNKGAAPTTAQVGASSSSLTASQVQSIIELLRAFNADQSVINNVNAALSH